MTASILKNKNRQVSARESVRATIFYLLVTQFLLDFKGTDGPQTYWA